MEEYSNPLKYKTPSPTLKMQKYTLTICSVMLYSPVVTFATRDLQTDRVNKEALEPVNK